jgi:hypothetical protein
MNRFNRSLLLKVSLPEDVAVMNPFSRLETRLLAEKFYERYYHDDQQRILILGINPGRLGGGSTGIPFTDPVKLETYCSIPNDLKKVTEPSAGFVYDVINAYGGPDPFYSSYLIHAVCPLGFTRKGVNYNYYDSRELEKAVTPFIRKSLHDICDFPVNRKVCYCLGNGKNYKFLNKINHEEGWFGKVEPLPHPRWIVQYRRKRYNEFIDLYLKTFA